MALLLLVNVGELSHLSEVKCYQASKTFQAFWHTVARAGHYYCTFIAAAPGQIRTLGVQVEFWRVACYTLRKWGGRTVHGKESHVLPMIAGANENSCGVMICRDGVV